MIVTDLFESAPEQGVTEAGFPGAPDVEMPPMKPSGDPKRDKLKQEYMNLHREIKSLVDLQYTSKSAEEKIQAKARIKQLNDRADQIRAILEPRQPPNEWQKKTYGYDDNWNKVNQGVAEGNLNELDMFAPRTVYFKMADGNYIKADYRGSEGLTGHKANDNVTFTAMSWVPVNTARSLGLDKFLAKGSDPSTTASQNAQNIVGTSSPGEGPLGNRTIDVVDFVNSKEDTVPSALKTQVMQWVGKNTTQQQQGVAEGWRDFFGSKSAPVAPTQAAATTGGAGSLSPRFSARIPNPETGQPYTNAELRALANNKVEPTLDPIDATAKKRTGGKKSGEVSMTPDAIRKRNARKSVTTAVAPAPNPFGQMVNQLQNYKTSTGGQVRGTATGLKHTASPDNPNAVPAAADSTSNPFGQMANRLQNYTTNTGGQVQGTATGLKHAASPNEPNAMTAAAPAVTSQPVATPAATTRKKQTPKTTAATPVARPNFATQNLGYKSVNYAPNVKTGASMPKPFVASVPPARAATKVTSGGPTPDEKAKLAQRIAQAVKEPVAEMLQMVETKEDVQRIKKFIDDTFVKHGAVNESAFVVRNKILEHVTQVGAQRRRDFAAQQAQ